MQRVTWHLPDLGEMYAEVQDHEAQEFTDALRMLGHDPEVTPC